MTRRSSSQRMLSNTMVYVLLFAALPLISCKGLPNNHEEEQQSQQGEVHHTHSHSSHHYGHHRRHQGELAAEKEIAEKGAGKDWKLNSGSSSADMTPQLFAGYRESYITKKAATELFDKMKRFNRPITEDEYNELLQKIVIKPKSDPKYSIYNKKYYDYLPTESIDGEDEELGKMMVEKSRKKKKKTVLKAIREEMDFKSLPMDDQLWQGERSHRSKRSPNEEDNHGIGKRQAGTWANQYVRSDRQQATPRYYQPQYNAARGRQAVVLAQNYPSHVQQQHSNIGYQFASPWSNRFYSQTPTNYYLPVAPPPPSYEHPQFIVRPQQPFMRLPIPGVVFNPAFPPKNPHIPSRIGPGSVYVPTNTYIPSNHINHNNNNNNNNNNVGNKNKGPKGPNQVGDDGVKNRFGEDEDYVEEKFIFDREDIRPARPPPSTSRTPAPRFPSSPRTPPPLIKTDDDDEEELVNTNFITVAPPRRLPSQTNTFNQQPTARPSAASAPRRTPPPLIKTDDEEDEDEPIRPTFNQLGNQNSNSNRPANARPFQTARPPTRTTTTNTTTRRPPVTQQQTPEELSRCVWAIVNCCVPQDQSVRYSCFERLGCHGAFWEINPCSEEVLNAAVSAADRYFY